MDALVALPTSLRYFGVARKLAPTIIAAALALVSQAIIVMPLRAQAVTGTIHGTISDTTGARVPGVPILAMNLLTGEPRTATSDSAGDYIFPVLPVGQYRIQVEVQGFKKFTREGITLNVNQNARIDVSLEVGAVSEVLTVTGDAPLVDTRQVQHGGLVDSRQVSDLPLNGRNVYDLVSILPGVSAVRLPTVQDRNGNFIRVNGSRSRQSTFLLDGGFNNDQWRNNGNSAPNPDAVEEFRLLTSNFSAEYGRSPGGVVNVVTRSGTNQFRGTLFEFLRNNKLNARNFFRPTVTPLRQNQFGASTGGPIRRNKLFFFGSYQGLRIRSSAFQNAALTATRPERQGDFSSASASQRPVDPDSKTPFPDGQIPASRLDPVASRILQLVPFPNTPDGRLEVEAPTTSDEDQALAKIDYQLSDGHRLFGSFFAVEGNSFQPFGGGSQIPGYAATDDNYSQQNLVVNEDWLISPALLNQLRFTYSRKATNTFGLVRTSWPDFGSQVKLGALPPSPPQIFITGRWQMGSAGQAASLDDSFGWSDTLTWVRGKHSIRAGSWYLYNRFDATTSWLGAGQIRFSGNFTRNALADFLLGRAQSFRQNNGADRHFRSHNWHSFAQDDWKAHRKVTFNLGLRYELNTPYVSLTDEFQTFRFRTPSQVISKAPLGMLFPGDAGVPRGIAKLDANNFAPRLGIAIDPFGNGKTAIRAGYGIFYAIGHANFSSDLQGQPFKIDFTVFGTPSLVDPYATTPGGSPFPHKFVPDNPRFFLPVTASYLAETFATPYVCPTLQPDPGATAHEEPERAGCLCRECLPETRSAAGRQRSGLCAGGVDGGQRERTQVLPAGRFRADLANGKRGQRAL
ncbi:MAG: TonB-dependent receptor [Acidobacteriales bacterium]|nr:TonB-dependent receptor [Terriglobales bacterium]